MMKNFLLAIIIAGTTVSAAAQAKPLKIGDTVPELTFHMVNYGEPEVRLSGLKGKLVILDFWSIWCGSCIHAMPTLQHLQEQFGDKIMVLPVCFSFTQTQVQEFFAKRRGTEREIKLPSAVCEDFDNDVARLFPTQFFPHEVWIDSSGVVRAITESAYVTAANIERLLHGQRLSLPTQSSQQEFDPSKPVLIAGNGGSDSNFLYRSLLTGFIDSIYGSAKQHDNRLTRLFVANTDITSLVKMSLFHRINDVYNKQVVWEVADRSRYVRPAYDTNFIRQMQQTAHCYELILPPSFTLAEAYTIMRADICRFFHIETAIEKRQAHCWVLKESKAVAFSTKGGEPLYKEENDYTQVLLQNRPLADLVAFLSRPGVPVLLDETGYKGNVDMEIDVGDRQYDIASINKKLEHYGLVFTEAIRIMDMLVIKELKQ